MPMPYKSEKIKIQGTKHDRRAKLTPKQKVEIKKLYEAGDISQRALADMYNVSRRLIVFCIYPERLAANVKVRNERGGSKQYYVKEKHRVFMKEHRKYKQKLYVDGAIKFKPEKKVMKNWCKIIELEANDVLVQKGMSPDGERQIVIMTSVGEEIFTMVMNANEDGSSFTKETLDKAYDAMDKAAAETLIGAILENLQR